MKVARGTVIIIALAALVRVAQLEAAKRRAWDQDSKSYMLIQSAYNKGVYDARYGEIQEDQ